MNGSSQLSTFRGNCRGSLLGTCEGTEVEPLTFMANGCLPPVSLFGDAKVAGCVVPGRLTDSWGDFAEVVGEVESSVLTEDLPGLGVVGMGGLFRSVVDPKESALDFDAPPVAFCPNPLEAASVGSGNALVLGVTGSGAQTQVASPIVQSVPVSMVNFDSIGCIKNESVQTDCPVLSVHILSALCVQQPPCFCNTPSVLRNTLVVFGAHHCGEPLCELDNGAGLFDHAVILAHVPSLCVPRSIAISGRARKDYSDR
jgi:hypothetical protein